MSGRRPAPAVRLARGISLGLLAVLWAAMTASGDATPGAHRIDISGLRFPGEPTEVSVGDTITWLNRDIVPHTVDGVMGGVGWTSGAIGMAEVFTLVATEPARVEYRCDYHPSMTGVLIVHP